MPRKRKSSTGELRDKAIRVHLTVSELEYLKERAGSLSLSEYLLKAGLGQAIPQRRKRQPLPQVNRELLLQVGRMGGNLNQITRACHLALRQGMVFPIDWQLLQSLQGQLRQLGQAIAGLNSAEDEMDEDL
jgi:hypothetical protein